MKIYFTLLVTMLISFLTKAQEWSGSTPGDIFYNSGNVGIGISTPAVNLHVKGSSNTYIRLERSNNSSLDIRSSATTYGSGLSLLTGNKMFFTTNGDITNPEMVLMNGNLGIGTKTPAALLDVSAQPELDGSNPVTLRISSNRSSSNWQIGADITGLDFYSNDGSGTGKGVRGSIKMYTENTIGSKYGFRFLVDDGASLNEALRIDSESNVGIGTSDPQSKLSVNGEVRATRIKVTADINEVPDYVFTEGYNLKSLREIEDYIKNNKHLPNVPSAHEIVENGLDLGTMNLRLLEKIEELVLHQIQLLNRIESLEDSNEELRKEITARIKN